MIQIKAANHFIKIGFHSKTYKIFLALLFFLSACSNEKIVPFDTLVTRDGIRYEVNSDIPFTGTGISYHDNGNTKWQHSYVNGVRSMTKDFYPDGKLKEERFFSEGLISGTYKTFYENGQLKHRSNYIPRDIKNCGGKVDMYIFFCSDKDGISETYHYNGQLYERYSYVSGKKEGVFEIWYSSGVLNMEGSFQSDELNGEVRIFSNNGRLSQKIFYSGNRWDGPYESYHPNGQLSIRATYKSVERGWDGPYGTLKVEGGPGGENMEIGNMFGLLGSLAALALDPATLYFCEKEKCLVWKNIKDNCKGDLSYDKTWKGGLDNVIDRIFVEPLQSNILPFNIDLHADDLNRLEYFQPNWWRGGWVGLFESYKPNGELQEKGYCENGIWKDG